MNLSTIAVAAAHFLTTGDVPYHGHDHLAELLPAESQVLVVHQQTQRATGWFGLDNSVRRGCDNLNHILDWEKNKENSMYYQTQKGVRNPFLDSYDQYCLDFYQRGNHIRRSVKMILPDASEEVIFREYSLIEAEIEKIIGSCPAVD